MYQAYSLLLRLKGHAPGSGISPDQARKEFSELYLQYQKPCLPDMQRVAIRSDLFGYWVGSHNAPDKSVILFFHGGGFSVGSTRDHLGLIADLVRTSDAAVLSIDYRLAPEHCFPAALLDSIDGYRFLLEEGYSPKRIILAGISAGGTLALGLALYARDLCLSMPAGLIAMSPAVDMLFSGESVARNRDKDWIPPERLHKIREIYLAGSDPRNPLASPIYAELSGLPPLLVQAGTHEVLFDDISRFAEKASLKGVPVTYERYQGMFHCWQIFGQLPDAEKAIFNAGDFVKRMVE
ncbi:MAG: alpha/beta hydrolase [Methanomicrobiaceae archaeon]|nr:alpha/beta hydrolase [Methanomicrobiaceae archaeon]